MAAAQRAASLGPAQLPWPGQLPGLLPGVHPQKLHASKLVLKAGSRLSWEAPELSSDQCPPGLRLANERHIMTTQCVWVLGDCTGQADLPLRSQRHLPG